jgi:HAD superfamily phosphoserine phosphatase-like hydrolase
VLKNGQVKTLPLPNGSNRKLAVFDVEGVLIPKNRLFFDVAKSLGMLPLMKVLFYGFLYGVGLLPLKRALTKILWVMRGTDVGVFFEKLDNLPRTPNAPEVFSKLKAEGYRTALISSGLPTFLVEKLAAKIGADYAIGVEVGIENNLLTGEIWGDVTERNGKFLVLKELMDDQQLSPKDCVVIADDRNNTSIFFKEAKKIGFNPDFVIRIKADSVATGKLTNILPIIHGEARTGRLPSQNDFTREFIHGSGFFVPLLAIFFGVPIVALFIVVVVSVYSVSEFDRVRGKNLPFFSTITRHAASQSELCEFTLSPVYFAFGILLTLLLVPAPASYAAIAIFTLGDSTASLIGGTLTKKPLPLNKTKTIEGTLGGFFFALLAACAFVAPWTALVGAAVGMFIEYLPLPVNDNLLIPLSAGLVLMFIA